MLPTRPAYTIYSSGFGKGPELILPEKLNTFKMRILTSKTTNFITLLLLVVMLFSCQERGNSDATNSRLLAQAQDFIGTDPKQALIALDSISNPDQLDKDSYMRYILARVQAKYKTNQNISQDTLIFDAAKYFDETNNAELSTLANFYAGGLYREKKMIDKALNSYLHSKDLVSETNNSLLKGKILHNVADLYYEQDIMDSALIYYKQAFDFLEKDNSTPTYKLTNILFIGHTFYNLGQKDSAHFYYDKGLKEAIRLDDKNNQTTFLHQLGLVSRDLKNYPQAVSYLNKALEYTQKPADSLKTYHNLLKTYNYKQQPDSAKIYINILENRFNEVEDKYLLRNMYEASAEYYKQIKDYEKALYYREQQKQIDQEIKSGNKSVELFDADKRFHLSLKDKQLKGKHTIFIYLTLILLLLITAGLIYRDKKREKKYIKRNKELQEKIEKQKSDNQALMQKIYDEVSSKLSDKEIKELKDKYGNESLQNQLKRLVDYTHNKGKQQLMKWADSYLIDQPIDQSIVKGLDDKNTTLLALLLDKTSDNEISLLLEIPIETVDAHKQQLRSALQNAGLDNDAINKILS